MDRLDLTRFDTSIPTLSRYLHRCSDTNAELDTWYQELLAEAPSPLYWTMDSNLAPSSAIGDKSNEALRLQTLPPFSFPTLRLGCITASFWALKLILSYTIALTCGAVLSTNNHSHDHSSHTQSTLDLMSMAQNLLNQHDSPCRLRLATNIMRAMPYCLNDSMGLIGAQKSLFALRVALFSLRRHPGEELKWCQAVYQELDGRRGLRYAREIAKLDGKYNAAGRDGLPTGVPSRDGSKTVVDEQG